MIEKQFWMDAKAAWIVSATPQITKVHTGSGGTIDPSLLSNPWDTEVSFDDIESGNCFGTINDIVSISFEDNQDKVKADILGKLFIRQENIQKRIKRVLKNRGHVCNRYKDYLSKINKLIYTVI